MSARDHALRALRHRDYFEAELRVHLAAKGCQEPEIEATINDLGNWGFLNDERVGTNAMELARKRGEGKLGILSRLREKGASEEVITQIDAMLEAEDQPAAARELLAAKSPKNPEAAARLLWRKGYEEDVIETVLESWEPTA